MQPSLVEIGRTAVRRRWPSSLPRRLRKLQKAGRVADWLSALSPSRNSPAVPVPVRRVGVFMQWGIGDSVLMAPLLRGLRAAYPDALIELIGRPWLRELFGDTALADDVHELTPPWTRYTEKYRVWQPAWWDFLQALSAIRQIPFDVVVSARCDPRELLQLRLVRARLRVGYGERAGKRWLDVDLGVPPHLGDGAHASATAAHVAEVLTGYPTDARPWLPVPSAIVDGAVRTLDAAGYSGGLVVAVCPDAGASIREWSARSFDRVLRDLSADVGFVVVISDPHRPIKPLCIPDGVASMVWQSGLGELLGLLSVADLLLCNDSGVMHMASACDCPVVAVFGPTSKAWYGPSGESDEVVMVEPMPCRPCLDLCIYPRPICMDGITPEMVSRGVARRISRLGPPRMRRHSARVAAPARGDR